MREKFIAKIKFWNERRGYGFIIMDDGNEIFGHDSQLVGEWIPNKNDTVEFVMGDGSHGPDGGGVILGDPNMQRR